MDHQFSPGSLVRARGREWTVLPGTTQELCLLRPLAGREGNDETGILTKIEKVEPAEFPFPTLEEAGDASSARLLRDAARLSIRTGVGPFRSFGRISVEPRAYQLVPLILALKQDLEAIRLLIADDVGVGKTVEAMLIVRELLDRNEVKRFCILCPAHLVTQWGKELKDKFHIDAVEVTAKKAATLEKQCTPGKGIFDEYPFTVVSIDFIKSERNRNEFYAKCPDLLVVDEAHECADSSAGKTQQLRHKLLFDISQNPKKNILLLTATPHSGKKQAFRSLISILNQKLANKLPEDMSGFENEKIREELSNYFVQRRRPDIKKFLGDNLFPERIRNHVTYILPKMNLDLCTSILAQATKLQDEEGILETSNKWRQAQWWSAFTLVLALTSSPKAAFLSLCRRSALKNAKNEEELKKQAHRDIFGSLALEQNYIDDNEEEGYFLSDEEVPGVSFENEEIDFISQIKLEWDDTEKKKTPSLNVKENKENETKKKGRKKKEIPQSENQNLSENINSNIEDEEFILSKLSKKQRELAEKLKSLSGKKDPKLQNLIHEILIKKCLPQKRNIVIFCRFIDTAKYIYDELVIDEFIKPFALKGKLEIRTLTGKNSPDERHMVLKDFQEHDGQRILICTDCLSEGVNLQELFNTVVHYDFAWNPNRHEQREGRVDRLLQKSPEVHIYTLIGKDHPIEKIFLRVLHEKQKQIRSALGVHIPITDVGEEILQLALNLKEEKEADNQILLFEDNSGTYVQNEKGFKLKKLEAKIDKIKEDNQKASKTFYSHSKVTVDDVKKELDAMKQSLGSQEDVEHFILTLIERTRGSYQKKERYVEAQIPELQLKNRLGSNTKKDFSFKLSFDQNCLSDVDKLILRTSPEIEDISRTVLETSLDALIRNHPLKVAARAGVMRTKIVGKRTSVILGRFRYLLREEKEDEPSLVEEIIPILFEGSPADFSLNHLNIGESAELILSKGQPDANVTVAERDRFLKPFIEASTHICNELSFWQKEKRVFDILETHKRVRSQGSVRRVRVECVGIPDVLGVYVFLPVVNWN